MATIQPKVSRGHKYWYIVESRRVNGKPRPVVLAYLGKAEDLLRRLHEREQHGKIKSYSHGAVAALLRVAQELDVPALINRFIQSPRPYMGDKPVRHDLTAGMTLVLGAIGRVCMPTSKQGWWEWAKTTSCEYLLRCALGAIDSQHFWDLMDALPVDAIERIEQELLERVRQRYGLATDTLFYDTTNFFTFIATTNERCTIAKRGKNKQKRHDLRQVGLALVVTRQDHVPLFHLTYEGNQNDCKVFEAVLGKIRQRMEALGLDLDKHTLVFDRGNNSKKNLALVAQSGLHYVGALTPYHHRPLVKAAMTRLEPLQVHDQSVEAVRVKEVIWGAERTIVVFVSDRLKAGQLRGVYAVLEKTQREIDKIQRAAAKRPQDQSQLRLRIDSLLSTQFLRNLIDWSLTKTPSGRLQVSFTVHQDKLAALENDLGFRILITDRHDWPTEDIILAFYGQANAEQAFENLKNPYHLALKPQFHWTDQKIVVHYFMCVLGYLMSTILWRDARTTAHFKGTLDSLLDRLNNIRLAASIQTSPRRGRPKLTYQLEQMSEEERTLCHALRIDDLHIHRPKLNGVSVYA